MRSAPPLDLSSSMRLESNTSRVLQWRARAKRSANCLIVFQVKVEAVLASMRGKGNSKSRMFLCPQNRSGHFWPMTSIFPRWRACGAIVARSGHGGEVAEEVAGEGRSNKSVDTASCTTIPVGGPLAAAPSATTPKWPCLRLRLRRSRHLTQACLKSAE